MTNEDIHRQLVIDYKETFESPHGKRVLEDLRRKTTYDKSSVSFNRTNPIDINRLVYDEGQRAMLVYILRMLSTNLMDEPRSETAISE